MAGAVKRMIQELLEVRSAGNPAVERFLHVHLICKGIRPDKYDDNSEDDPAVIEKLEEMLRDFAG